MEKKKNILFSAWGMKILMWCGLWLMAGHVFAVTAVSRLRVNAMENPIGIDDSKPAFTWTLTASDEERGILQTAYEVKLYTDKACQNEFWSSGKVESDLSVDRPYDGPALQAGNRYYWRVTVWDNKGGEATSDEMASSLSASIFNVIEETLALGFLPTISSLVDWNDEMSGYRKDLSYLSGLTSHTASPPAISLLIASHRGRSLSSFSTMRFCSATGGNGIGIDFSADWTKCFIVTPLLYSSIIFRLL